MSQTRDATLANARSLQRTQPQQAIALLETMLTQSPDDGEAWYELAYHLKAQARYQDALDAFGHALAAGIDRPEEAHLNRGVLYSDHLRRDDEAERELRAALEVKPGYISALLNLGNLQEERGQKQAALQTYAQVLETPESAHPHDNHLRMEALARKARLAPPATIDDPLIAALQDAAAQQEDKTVRANLLFALGHVLDRLGQHESAFDAYAKANRWLLRQSGRRHDRMHAERLTDALIAASSAGAAMPEHAPGDNLPVPLLICGMFRSGSTLVEQVLGAHPQVVAGGELDHLPHLAAVRLAPFPASVSSLEPGALQQLGVEYRQHLATLYPQARTSDYITDKRPDNYLLIGLAKKMLPGLRIVHTVRNPLDNGLSIYFQHLNPLVAAYSCDLSDIGHQFGQYQRLMQHWKAHYPQDILDFDYDAFVRQPEPELRRLLDFLELDWDPALLRFHERETTVKTASYWQVREPLHQHASGRSAAYARWLAPLETELQAAGVLVTVGGHQ